VEASSRGSARNRPQVQQVCHLRSWTAANHPRLKYSVETARTAKRLIDFGLSCVEVAAWLAVPHSFVRDVKCGRRAL
jgi:hypothetical protein